MQYKILSAAITIIPSWYFYHFVEYALHKLSHNRKYGGIIYKIHMNHHKIYYPCSKFVDRGPFKCTKILGVSDVVYAYSPFVFLVTAGFYYMLPYDIFICIIFEIYLFLYISDYIHMQIHIAGSWLEKFPFFMQLRSYHYWHHVKLSKNLSLSGLDTTYDKIFKTLR